MLNNTKVLGIFLSTTLMCVTTASAVEVGAFLVKIDGRYSISQSHNGLVPSLTTNGTNITAKSLKNKNLNGYGIGAGFGYVASDNIITDVTFAYNNSKTKTDSTNLAITKVDDNTLSAMLNGQYRFNLHNRISPYTIFMKISYPRKFCICVVFLQKQSSLNIPAICMKQQSYIFSF